MSQTTRRLIFLAAILLPASAAARSDFCAAWDRLSPAEKFKQLLKPAAEQVTSGRQVGENALAAAKACLESVLPPLGAQGSLDRACEDPEGPTSEAVASFLTVTTGPCLSAARAQMEDNERAREQREIEQGLEERARQRRAQVDADVAALRQAEVICRGRASQVPLVDPGPYPTPDGDLGSGISRGAAWGSALGSNLARQRQAFEGCMAELGFVER